MSVLFWRTESPNKKFLHSNHKTNPIALWKYASLSKQQSHKMEEHYSYFLPKIIYKDKKFEYLIVFSNCNYKLYTRNMFYRFFFILGNSYVVNKRCCSS